MEAREKFAPDVVLRTWRTMMKALPKMNEAELKQALDWEMENSKRKDCIERIHRKLFKLRRQRQIKEILQ